MIITLIKFLCLTMGGWLLSRMALNFPAATMTGGITVRDYNDQNDAMDFNLNSADAAAATTDLKAIATAYADAVGGCSLQKLRITEITEGITDNASAPINPVPFYGIQKQMVARLRFNTANNGIYSIDMPAPIESVLDANDKKRVNTSNPKMAAFIALMIAKVNASDGSALLSLKDAFIKHHGSKIG